MGSCDVYIGMEKHHVILNYLEKNFTCANDSENPCFVNGLRGKNYTRQIYALQLERSVGRGYKFYAISIQDCNKETHHKIYDIPILQYIRYVFPGDVPGLPPKRDLEFFINLVSGAVLVSKSPYWMSTP